MRKKKAPTAGKNLDQVCDDFLSIATAIAGFRYNANQRNAPISFLFHPPPRTFVAIRHPFDADMAKKHLSKLGFDEDFQEAYLSAGGEWAPIEKTVKRKHFTDREMHFKIFDALDRRFPEMYFTNEDRIAVVLNTIKGSSESSVERDLKLWRRAKRGK